MRLSRRLNARLAIGCLALCAWMSTPAAPEAGPDIESLMARVRERVAEYYRRARTVVGDQTSTVQPIRWNWSPEGLARTVESEVRVEFAGADGGVGDPMLVRTIRRINGRAPREHDLTDRSGCTDPEPASADPLAFLLPVHRHDYRFISVARDREQDRAALVIDFRSANRTSRPELMEDQRGHADCFDWSGPVARRGRVWVDASTFDVLRVDRRNEGPVDIRVPWRLERRYRLPPWIVVDRDDLSVRFKPVAFRDPDEVIVLPESLTAVTIVRSALQSIRRTETYRNYRRFLTKGRMVKDP